MPDKNNENISDTMDIFSGVFRVFWEIVFAFRIPEYRSYTRQLITQLETLRNDKLFMEKKETEFIYIREMIDKLIEKLNMIHDLNASDERMKEMWEKIRIFMLDSIKKFEMSEIALANETVEKINDIKNKVRDQIRNQIMIDIKNLNIQIGSKRNELLAIQDRLYNRFDEALNAIPPRDPFNVNVMNESGMSIPVKVDPMHIQGKFKALIRDGINKGNRNPDCMLLVRNAAKEVIVNNLEKDGHNASDIEKLDIDHALQTDSTINNMGMECQKNWDKNKDDPDTQQDFDKCDQLRKEISDFEKLIENKNEYLDNLSDGSLDDLLSQWSLEPEQMHNETKNDSFSNNTDMHKHFGIDSNHIHDDILSLTSTAKIKLTLSSNNHAIDIKEEMLSKDNKNHKLSGDKVKYEISNENISENDSRKTSSNKFNGIESKSKMVKKSSHNVTGGKQFQETTESKQVEDTSRPRFK